jgi:hypothetical protein
MSTPTPAPATATATATTPINPAPAVTGGAVATTEVVPGTAALLQAARLAIQQDKPIQLDYYAPSANTKAFLGEDPDTKEKVLVKSKEEFTSLVQKLYKVGDDYLILTENSIYIVSGKIQKRKVNLAALQGE